MLDWLVRALTRFLSSERTLVELADPWAGAGAGAAGGAVGGTFSWLGLKTLGLCWVNMVCSSLWMMF